MTCEEAREARLDRASGPLEPERERALAQHTERCDACRAFAVEIDLLEANIEDTLQEAATVEVARRFRPRSRWAPLAAAAVAVASLGAGFFLGRPSVAPSSTIVAARATKDTDFKLGVQEGPEMRSGAAVGASAVVVAVVSGAVLLKMNDGQDVTVKTGETAVAQVAAPIRVGSPAEEARKEAEAAKKIAKLEAALARSEARVHELEEKAAASSASVTAEPKPATPRPATNGVESGVAPVAESSDEKVKALVAKFDWKGGTAALVAYFKAQQKGEQSKVDPSIFLQLSKMNVVASEVAKVRGYENPWQAYQDADVREAFYPAWLDALGTGLDDTQTAALKRHVHDAVDTKPADPSFLGTLAKELDDKLAEERWLGTLLRPEQMQRYYDSVGDDALLGAHVDRNVSRCSTQEALADCIAGEWKKTFDLSPQSVAAAQGVAQKYAQEAASLPLVDPALDVAARRVAATQRAIALANLQVKMERELAALPGLTDAERARVQEGARVVYDYQLKK